MTTLLAARASYFAENDFGDDGGYSKPTVTIYLFGIPVAFPNTEGRKRAVVYHDLHHITTGYATNNLGEAEISAWELGSGCTAFRAALVLNTMGLMLGVFQSPRRVYAAFVRGRRTRNLYGRDVETLLQRRVTEVRAELGLDEVTTAAPGDARAFAGYLAVSLLVATLPVLLIAAGIWALWG
ncbi:MAG: hypothetical protein AAGA54_29405 [Myxococcota bacterium]